MKLLSAFLLALPLAAATPLLPFAAAIPSAHAEDVNPRSRTNFDAGWLFQKGDPVEGNAAETLAYPKTKDAVIASTAGFLATEGTVPKPDVPADLGKDVPCTQPAFNDASWRKLDLPHDWAIEGPFDQTLPGDTGKLPWQGAGWYRKHFTIPSDPGTPNDARTFLDIDGAMSYSLVWCNGQSSRTRTARNGPPMS